jgi:UPF0755 protein
MEEKKSTLALFLASVELHFATWKVRYATGLLSIVLIGVALWFSFLVPPASFPVSKSFEVKEHVPLYETAKTLEEAGYIRSEEAFIVLSRLLGSDTQIQAGRYVFHAPADLLTVLNHLTNGISGIALVRVRLEEGMTARQMGDVLTRSLTNFDNVRFEEIAIPLEGYLFPDTYFFPEDATPEEVVERMYQNFDEQIAEIDEEFRAFDAPLPDVIIMASLLEREARSLEEKRKVAGILYHRLELDMPLQVDAVFGYINNRETYSPSFSDLEVDSPYNTYLYKGLPPGPIANPGLASLLAAVTPIDTKALYYLTGRDGRMYYATTFAEHKLNRARYLD